MTQAMGLLQNRGGNVRFRATAQVSPSSLADLQRLIASSRRVRPIGTAHSFSSIADTDGILVSTVALPNLIDIDTARATVRVGGGLRYSDIAAHLNDHGLALPNLASLADISIAGAVATGTHGSGDGNGGLATAVSDIELITSSGEIIAVRVQDAPGMVVALGALGVVTALTLQAVPAFSVRQYVYTGVPFTQALEHFDEMSASGYSVSMFTDWRSPCFNQCWLKITGADEPAGSWFGGTLASRDLHPIAGLPTENCTPQRGVLGPWHERLPHERLQHLRSEFASNAGDEPQSEYLVAREHAADALAALAAISADLAPVTKISEVRTVAADELWLSPAYRRDCVAFHFTWVRDANAFMPVAAKVEAVLASFAARPHWGKIFTVGLATLAELYPRMDDFRRLASDLDPDGKFRNPMLDSLLG